MKLVLFEQLAATYRIRLSSSSNWQQAMEYHNFRRGVFGQPWDTIIFVQNIGSQLYNEQQTLDTNRPCLIRGAKTLRNIMLSKAPKAQRAPSIPNATADPVW